MLTVRLEQKKKKWDGDLFCYLLDLIPSQQIIIKTTVTTSHQSNVSFRKKKKKWAFSCVLKEGNRAKLSWSVVLAG